MNLMWYRVSLIQVKFLTGGFHVWPLYNYTHGKIKNLNSGTQKINSEIFGGMFDGSDKTKV